MRRFLANIPLLIVAAILLVGTVGATLDWLAGLWPGPPPASPPPCPDCARRVAMIHKMIERLPHEPSCIGCDCIQWDAWKECKR